MANECGGIGAGSILAIVVVAMMLLFVPLMIGPVAPPTPPLILVFPIVLLFVFLYLHFTSKWNLFFLQWLLCSIRIYVFSRLQFTTICVSDSTSINPRAYFPFANCSLINIYMRSLSLASNEIYFFALIFSFIIRQGFNLYCMFYTSTRRQK